MAHIDASPRIAVSTLNKHIRKRVEPVFRTEVLLGGMKAAGRVTYNNTGKAMDWRVRFRRRQIVAGDGNPVSISFPSVNTKKTASLPWRQYQLGENVTKYEKLVGQTSDVALFKIVEEATRELTDDFNADFPLKLFGDGYATGSKDIHGLESIFSGITAAGGGTGSSLPTSGDTYGGIDMSLGFYGGSWTGDWPVGTGDEEYHFFTPLVVDVGDSFFSGTATWAQNWQAAIRYLTTYGETLQKTHYDLLLLNPELLRTAKDSLEEKERFIVTQKSGLTDIGFKTLQFEGLELTQSYGVPADVGYGLRWDKMELKSMQGQLFASAKDDDITTSTELIAMDFYGNLMVDSPAYLAKLHDKT